MNRRTFLKKSGTLGLMIGFGSSSAIFKSCRKSYDFELLLKNGLIYDGTGEDGFVADIAIKNKKIVGLGKFMQATAYRIIDVSDLAVAPGFIDVHSHAEDELLVNPKAESKIRQGVTTEILGQDGDSIAPLTEEMREKLNERYQSRYGLAVDWFDFDGYFQKLSKAGVAVNVASMIGQGTLRQNVMGMSDRGASQSEIDQMKKLADTALQRGALGISSGLEYTPGGFASTEEITQLCEVMPPCCGVYATHMRNEDDTVIEALEEAIQIAYNAGVTLHISHLKCSGKRNWHKLDAIFEKISEAEVQGLEISFDRYPYVAYNTTLASLMPLWSREGGSGKFVERLKNDEIWLKIKNEMQNKIDLLGSWEAVMISSVALEKNKSLQGQTVSEIVQGTRQDPFEFVRSLIIEEENRVDMVGFAMSEENTARILAHPLCMAASDASTLATYGPLHRGNPHPRGYGTFPRLLGKYAREDKVMSLAEAVRKITSLPARRFSLWDRGQIAANYFADLVVFNPETVIDNATFDKPHQYPEGIEFVIVNGEVVIEHGENPGRLPGMIIRS